MRATRFSFLGASLFVVALAGAGCGDDGGGGASLEDYLPEIPVPTGEAQQAFAGQITASNTSELIPGPASSGMVGDYFMRNDKARFVIQAATRVIGVIPQGGNLVDAVYLEDGVDAAEDHFGELSAVYLLGRTCEHQTIEVLQDGSGGGVAAIRARGLSGNNDFINIRGIGLLTVPVDLDPEIADSVECATTYVLAPGSDHVEVSWTFYNPSDLRINGPFGTLNDTGGEVEQFSPTRGFERLGIEALTSAAEPAPVDYTLYQGPGIAYGIIPRLPDPNGTNATFLIAGVSVTLYGANELLDIVNPNAFYFLLEGHQGINHRLDFQVGRDSAAAEATFHRGRETAVATVSGTATWSSGGGVGARIGFYEDTNGNSELDAEDVIRAYVDADSDGTFSGELRTGSYFARAEVKNTSRSAAMAITVGDGGVSDLALSLPAPVRYDFRLIDDANDQTIPGRISVFGVHPAFPDRRVFETYDRIAGVVSQRMAPHGTSVDVGDGADPQLLLPPGESYRIIATRGTEWSFADLVVTPMAGDPVQSIELRLAHVAPATGYLATEWHVHQVGSPDSPVLGHDRIATAVADGVEMFAVTDHDFVADLQPLVESMGLADFVRVIPGLEVTPFVYGHFNTWPLEPDPTTPNFGAIDWARGSENFAMTPGQIFEAMRQRGAELVQINHPRQGGGAAVNFQQFFDRAGLTFDYDAKMISGDLLAAPVPNEWMRLPGESLWDDSFNALEIWNGFFLDDTNDDGVRELARLDMVMRDWFNFLSFGLSMAPIGNSDTHTVVKDPMGMPRTYVRVGDDSSSALSSGGAVADVISTLTAAGVTRDMVVTNGPHIEVVKTGETLSAIGSTVSASGMVSFDVRVTAPTWAAFDTLEIFANDTPELGYNDTALRPLKCLTTRDLMTLDPADVCATAQLAPAEMTVNRVSVGNGHERFEVTVTVQLAQADIAAVTRVGATGTDAWIVFRARGDRGIFPMMYDDDLMTAANIPVFVSGSASAQEALLEGAGVPATAFTAPIFVDFDGGGYKAIFDPQ